MDTYTTIFYRVERYYKGGTIHNPVLMWSPVGINHRTEVLAREAMGKCKDNEYTNGHRVVRVTEKITVETL